MEDGRRYLQSSRGLMDKKEICFWEDKYNKEEDLYVKGEEEQLRANFLKNKLITKQDLIRIIKWKFQGRLIGRQRRILKFIEEVDDDIIKEISSLAFRIKDDEIRLKLLCCIKGVGFAISSVILTFYDPSKYGVLDIHAWRGLFGREPTSLFMNIKYPIQFFSKLREISLKTELPCRDIEKAFFKKDLDG